MDGPHLSQLLDRAAATRPDHPAVEDEHGRIADLCRAAPRRRPAGDPPGAVGRRPGRPRRAVPAQGARGGRGDPRRPPRRARRTCRSTRPRPALAGRGHLRRRRGQGGGRRRRAGRRPPRGLARPRPVAPADRRRSATGRRSAPADAAWDEVHGRRRARRPCPRPRDGRRPGLHPLHLGLDRPAQGRDALARQRLRLPRLVRPDLPASATTTGFASHAPFHFDLSVFDLFASCRQRRDAGPDRRGAGQGPGAARRRSWPSGGSASGTRRRRSWRC